jgi:hypothetical protein
MPAASDALDPAIRKLDEVLRTHTDVSDLFKRGQLQAQKADFSRAIDDFTEVIRVNPEHVFALNNRCWARAILGGSQLQQLRGLGSQPISVAQAPLKIDLDIAANDPAELLETFPQRRGSELSFRIVLRESISALIRRIRSGCCACAVHDHAAAALPRRPTNAFALLPRFCSISETGLANSSRPRRRPRFR